MSRRFVILSITALSAVALAVAAAGCGGSKEAATTTTSSSATLAWAGSVCTAFSTWRSELTAAGKSLQANPTKDGVQKALDDAQAATKRLNDSLTSLGTPDTEFAKKAGSTLDTLRTQLQNDVSVIKRTIEQASGLSGASEAMQTVTDVLKTMREQLQAAGDELRSLPTGELEQAFNDAPACASLRTSTTPAS